MLLTFSRKTTVGRPPPAPLNKRDYLRSPPPSPPRYRRSRFPRTVEVDPAAQRVVSPLTFGRCFYSFASPYDSTHSSFLGPPTAPKTFATPPSLALFPAGSSQSTAPVPLRPRQQRQQQQQRRQ